MLTEDQVAELLAQANQQSMVSTTLVTPSVTTTTVIKEGEIIEPKQSEYKTEEQLREEATQLAIQAEKDAEILDLQTKLGDDAITDEEKEAIKLKLKELDPEAIETKETLDETPEQELVRLRKEIEDLKKSKEEPSNPLEAVELQAKEKGIEISELYKEYIQNGDLSEDSYKSLIDAGFNDTAIQAYIDTRITIEQTKATNIMTTCTGSVDNYVKMTEWMKENLSQDEINSYDKGVNSDHATIYVENMYSKYTKATTEPVIIRNNGYIPTNSKPIGFKSINEQNLAMADSRYGTDSKYTSEVRTKVLNSTY